MTIPTTIVASGPYIPNGATTVFPFGFKALSDTSVAVVLVASDGTETIVSSASYDVTLAAGDDPGGTVTMLSAPVNDGRELWIYLDPTFLQEIKFEDEGAFNQTILNQLADEVGSRSVWLRERMARAFLLPRAGAALDAVKGKFPVVLTDGTPGFSDGSGADGGLRSDLAQTTAGKGASLVAFKHSLPATPAIIDLRQLGSRRIDVRDWLGMDLTGTNDCASLIVNGAAQSAAAGLKLEVPAGIIALGSAVEVPAGAVIEGVSGLYMAGTLVGRSMFHIGHTGKGFTTTGPAGGRAFRHLATRRAQPAPGAGWAPTAHDWDFYCDGATDIEFDDVFLLNPTKGILATNGGGRFTFNRIWGQPLQVGIQVDTAYDVVRWFQNHFWPFWSLNSNVITYTLNNATSFYSKRNDNPDIHGLFSLAYRHGLRIGNWAGGGPGTTARLRAFGVGIDTCGSGLTVDSDVNGAFLELHGFYAHGHDTIITPGHLIDIQGTNSNIKLVGKGDLSNAHRSAINLAGAGSSVTIEDPTIIGYNLANGGYTAINSAAASAGVTVRGALNGSGGVSGAALLGGAGRIYGKFKRSFVPTVASSGGAITSYTINSAVYDVLDNEVEGIVDLTITNNGTGSGGLNVGLPITSNPGVFDVGSGEEIALFGKVLRVHIPNNSNTMSVVNYDNSYPGATNARIVIHFKYRL